MYKNYKVLMVLLGHNYIPIRIRVKIFQVYMCLDKIMMVFIYVGVG